MNFLAHIYLSGNNDLVKIGNFVGDWIKGNDYKQYPEDIQKGILMHRYIDSYTDNHPVIKKSKFRLNEKYHKYSGIIIDIFYDHFLAKSWKNYSNVSLDDFIGNLNKSLLVYMHYFSKDIQDFIPRFMKYKWIESYATLNGIEKVLEGMSKHTSLPDKTVDAIDILKLHYESFLNEFCEYFPQLIDQVESKFGVVFTYPDSKKPHKL
jgi:acyl carrier protein phosphodiesterase